MARTSMTNVISIGDPALGHNFDLFFPTIPGTTNTRDLTFKCQSTSIPGFSVEVATVDLHGVKVPYMGAQNFTQTLNITFVESISWSVRQAIRTWMESARSWITNTGSLAASYCVDPQIVLYDDVPNVVRTIQIYRAFPAAFDDIGVDGATQNNVLQAQMTLQYTYHQDI